MNPNKHTPPFIAPPQNTQTLNAKMDHRTLIVAFFLNITCRLPACSSVVYV